MQSVRAATGAQGVEYEHGDISVEFFAVFGYTEKAAVHGPSRGAQASSAGVLKGFAGFEQRLVAHHPESLDFFIVTPGVVHAPAAGNQLGRDFSDIGNGDGVGEDKKPLFRCGLIGQELGQNCNMKLIFGHAPMLS